MKAFYPGVGHRAQVALPLAFAAAMALSLLSLGLLHDQFPAVMGLAILTVPCFFLPELGLALFMLSGRFNLPLPEGFHEGPEMMTEISFLLVAPLTLLSLFRFLNSNEKSRILRLFIPFAILGLLIFFMGAGFTENAYTTDKIVRFWLVTLPGIFAALCIVRDRDSLRRFLWSVFAVGMALGVLSLPSLLKAHVILRVSALGGCPIQFARNLGLSFLVALMFLSRSRLKPILFGAMVLAGLLVLASGSRAPGMSLLGVSLLVFLAYWWRLKGGLKKLAVVYLAAPFLFYILANLFNILSALPFLSTKRYTMLAEDIELAGSSRHILWEAAWAGFRTNPWGWGTGSFAAMGPSSDLKFPHNIVLEVAFELGLLGLFLTLFIIVGATIISVKQIFSVKEIPLTVKTLSVMFIFVLLAYGLTNGDINNPSLWLLAALVMKFWRTPR